jgi:hypothetical protein
MDGKTAARMQMMIDSVQPHCDAPVRSVIVCQHEGAMGRGLAAPISSGLGSALSRHDAKKLSGGLPANVVLALTDDTLHAFAFKPGGWTLKPKLRIKGEVARWARADLVVAAERRNITNALTFTQHSSGTSFHLEATSAMGGQAYIDHFLTAWHGAAASR